MKTPWTFCWSRFRFENNPGNSVADQVKMLNLTQAANKPKMLTAPAVRLPKENLLTEEADQISALASNLF